MPDNPESWMDLAADLGIEVVTPFEFDVGEKCAAFTALIKDFGGSPGIAIDPDWSVLAPYVDALTNAGMGYSCVNMDGCDTNDLIELLRDWTWTGKVERRPPWL